MKRSESRIIDTINSLYKDVQRLDDEAEAMRIALVKTANWLNHIATGFEVGLVTIDNVLEEIESLEQYVIHSDFEVWHEINSTR